MTKTKLNRESETMNHAPFNWHQQEDGSTKLVMTKNTKKYAVLRGPNVEEFTAMITDSLNAHEDLVHELMRLRDVVGDADIPLIDAVLAKAGVKP